MIWSKDLLADQRDVPSNFPDPGKGLGDGPVRENTFGGDKSHGPGALFFLFHAVFNEKMLYMFSIFNGVFSVGLAFECPF